MNDNMKIIRLEIEGHYQEQLYDFMTVGLEYPIEYYEWDFIEWAKDIFHKVEWTLGLTAIGRIYGEQGTLDDYACDYNPNIELYNPDFYKFLVEKGIY